MTDPGFPGFGRPSATTGAPALARPAASAATAAYRAEGGDLAWCAVRATSVVGARHRLAGRAVEDTFAWAVTDDAVVLAVADGVGSLEGSGWMAEVAAVAACGAAVDALIGSGRGDSAAAVAAALSAANSVAGDLALSGNGGATTLVVAVVGIDGQASLGRVGDSDARVLRDGDWTAVFGVAAGCRGTGADAGAGVGVGAGAGVGVGAGGPEDDLVGTATDAIPALVPLVEGAQTDLRSGDAIVLLTDGVSRPLDDGPTTVAVSLGRALARPVAPLELAALADFSRQGCHDDRTMLVLWWWGRTPIVDCASSDQ